VTFAHDTIRLLIGTKVVTEYRLANAHKMADVAIEIGKRPDWCHRIKTSAKVSKKSLAALYRLYETGKGYRRSRLYGDYETGRKERERDKDQS